MIFDRLRKSMSVNDIRQILYGQSTSKSNVDVNQMTAMQNAVFFSCVRILAESVGQVPLELQDIDREGNRSPAKGTLADRLAFGPNPFQTTQEWLEQLVTHLAISGNYYGYHTDAGEILPLAPNSVTPRMLPNWELTYTVNFGTNGQDIFKASDRRIWHVKLFSLDGITGLSPVGYARETLGLAIGLEGHAAKLFANGAVPRGILSTDQKLTDKDFNRIKTGWDAAHVGEDNAHKTAILEQGLKFQQMSLSAEDSQFLQSRAYQAREIAALMRVPAHMLGDLSRSTHSNMEQQALEFLTQGLGPYFARIEGGFNKHIVPPAKRGKQVARFDTAQLLRADVAARGVHYTNMVQNGAMSPNEIRRREGMNPRAGGDVWLTPMNMARTDINGITQESQPAAKPPGPPTAPDEDATPEAGEES